MSAATAAEAVTAALFTLWVVWPFVGPGGYVTGFDTVAYSGPNLAVTLDAVRHGRVAQWDPFVYGGVSHLGNIQAAPLYLPKWPFAWMDVHRAWGWLVAVHVAWLALGIYRLVRRRLALGPPAGLVAVVTVVGSGAVMIRMLFFEQILVLAWAPWLLLAIDAVLAATGDRRGRPVALLALVVAATAVAGHPQVVYVLLPLAAVWTVVRAGDRHGRAWWRGLPPVAAGVALGGLIAAPQLLPAASAAARSANTGGRDLATVSNPGYSLQLSRLAGTWLGDPLATVHSVTTNGYENLAFVGVVATVAALVALAVLVLPGGRRVPWRWTTGGLGLVVAGAVVLAAGPRLPFYRAAFALVPGFDQARVPARWVIPAVLAAALLAAFGTEHLRRGDVGRAAGWAVVVVTAAAAIAVAAGPFTNPGTGTLLLWAGLAAGVSAVVVAGRRWGPTRTGGLLVTMVAVLGVAELGLAQRHSAARAARSPTRLTTWSTPAIDWLAGRPGKVFALTDDTIMDPRALVATLRPNANVLAGLSSPDGYDGGIQVTEAWAGAFAALADGPFQPEAPARGQIAVPLDPERLARLGVRFVLLDTALHPPAEAVPGWGPAAFTDGTDAVFENPAYLGPAWITDSSTGADAAWPPDGLQIDRPSPERLRLVLNADRPGRLIVAEQWDPGWEARLDGTPVAVVPGGSLYVGIDLPAGPHVVDLRYRAAHLRLGALLCGLAIAVVGVLGAEGPSPRRRR